MTIEILIKDTDNLVEAVITNEQSGAIIATGTVRIDDLVDSSGVTVPGGAFPLTLNYSGGAWYATLPYSLTLVKDAKYRAKLYIDAGTGLHGEFSVNCQCSEGVA